METISFVGLSVTMSMNYSVRSVRSRTFPSRKDGDLSDNQQSPYPIQSLDTNWNSIPIGINAMSKLLICSSNGRVFNIDNIRKDHVPLMKHPESFRKTLGQIANDAHGAFMLAHNNMKQIQLQMGQVRGYVEDSIDIIQSTNNCCDKILAYWGFTGLRTAKNRNLLTSLEKIKKIADNGLKWSTEISKAFNKLGQLNQQVLLAITSSHGAREREIEDAIHAKIEKEMSGRLIDIKYEQLDIQRQLANAREKVRSRQQELEKARQFEVGSLFGLFIFSLPLAVRIGNARTALSVAEERLQEIQQEAKRAEDSAEEERDKIYDDFIKRVEQMHVDVEKDKSRDEMIELLKEGMSQLSQLNSNWAGFTQNFNSINNYIEQVTQRALTDFVEDAKSVQEDDSIIHFMTNSINKSLECSEKTQNNAQIYVKFSNENIMKSLNDMQRCKNALPSC